MKIVVSIAVLLSIAAPARGASDWPNAQVTVHAEEPREAIPADFLGLSYEKPDIAQSHFRRGNAAMANLLRNLGSGVLRMGGTSVDRTYWRQIKGKPVSKKHATVVEPSALDSFYGFVQECGWRVIHGLNLGANDPAMAADEAAYAIRVGGKSVLALEIANEPDVFINQQIRPESGGYSYAQYHREIEAYFRAISARSPGAPLTGPATTKKSDWFGSFVRDFQGRIVLATSHVYPVSAKQTSPRGQGYASVDNLLTAATEMHWMPMIEDHVKASRGADVPFRLGECNSASGGGKEGVSDVFASALWGVDFLFDVAERGVAGVNFHSRFDKCKGYTPFCWLGDHYHVHPIYYSMLLFRQAMRGRTVPVDCQSPINVTAHAVLGDDHRLRVALINKDPAHGVTASVATGVRRGEASVIRLAAPSVTSKDGVTLAGSAVGQDGTWKPRPGEPVRCVKGRFELPLPAASAALLTIE